MVKVISDEDYNKLKELTTNYNEMRKIIRNEIARARLVKDIFRYLIVSCFFATLGFLIAYGMYKL